MFYNLLGYVLLVRLLVHQYLTACLIHEIAVYQCAIRFPTSANVLQPAKSKISTNKIGIIFNNNIKLFSFQITIEINNV